MKKIAIIVSSPMTIHAFMLHQVQSLAEYYDVTIIANVKDGERLLDNLPEGIHLYSIAIERKIDSFFLLRTLCPDPFSFAKSGVAVSDCRVDYPGAKSSAYIHRAGVGNS